MSPGEPFERGPSSTPGTPSPGDTSAAELPPPSADRALGELLLEAAGLDTLDLGAFLGDLDDRDPGLADAVRQRLEVVPGSFLAVAAADRLAPPGSAPPESPRASGRSTRWVGAPAEDDSLVRAAAEATQLDDTLDETGPTGQRTLGPPGAATRGGPTETADRPADIPVDMTWVSDRYSLGECLGEGGMARVFRAFDRKLSRPLALKFLTREEPAIRHRFLREARLQAQVRHDHVLDVYDTGQLGDRPYIAMRHIDGCTLEEVRDHTSLEEQVTLLIQAAEGLDAAHREGLIHRDVKPSNILVEEQPGGELRAFVADFGIATEPDSGEARSTLAGTPSYLAPELLQKPRGPVDRRTDVFSLGVTAYELFTGRRPYTADDPLDLLKPQRATPPPPRHWIPYLPADLEAIVLRAMAEDPEERYPTARALADDLRRYLAGEVVEAHAASLAYRVTRFVLRYQHLMVVAGVALAALAAASVVIAILAYQANEARQGAELRRSQAEGLVHFMVVELREKLNEVGRLDLLDRVHDAALEYFASVPADRLSDDELARQSQTLYQIGDVRVRRGDLAGAIEPFEESLALAQSLVDRHPDDGQRLYDLGQSHFWVGYVHWRRSDLAGALPSFEAYRDIALRLVEIDPSNLEWLKELSHAHSNLGSMLRDLGDFPGALAQLESTLAIDRRLSAGAPDDLVQRADVLHAHDALGSVTRFLGQLDTASTHLEASLELARSLVADDPSNQRWRETLGTCHEQLASLHLDRGLVDAARRDYGQAARIFEGLTHHDPENAAWQYKLAWTHIGAASVALAEGETEPAIVEVGHARRILEAGIDRDPSDLQWRRTLAVARFYQSVALAESNTQAAADEIEAVVEQLEGLLAERPTHRMARQWLGKSWVLRGRLAQALGDTASAQAAWQRAESVLAPLTDSQDGRVLAPRAEALLHLGRAGEAQPLIDSLQQQGFAAWERATVADGAPGVGN